MIKPRRWKVQIAELALVVKSREDELVTAGQELTRLESEVAARDMALKTLESEMGTLNNIPKHNSIDTLKHFPNTH